MKQRDTVIQIISYLDQIYSIFDSNTPCLLVYFDVKKCFFRSVPHHLLLRKFHDIGFDNDFIQLFQSHLNGRTQCAKVDGVLSSPVSVTTRVPQGIVMDQLLCILFFRDLSDAIERKFYLFFLL